MTRRAAQWFSRNLDVLAFGGALLSVGPLMAWWSVLVRRNIMEMDRLTRVGLVGLEPALREAALEHVTAHTERQLFMITGESVLASALMAMLALVLFGVARQREVENRRLQTTLQLTSHQLKTPIAGIRALFQSLAVGSIPAELQAGFLQQGVGECDRLEHLVETILAYQRAVVRQLGKVESVPTEQLIGDILKHRHQSLPSEAIEWKAHATSTVRCDPDAVRVVIENLLDNGRKYGGGRVELVEGVHKSLWRLEVRDQGQGFSSEDTERLFEPFERAMGPGVSHGSGLGLYIARQLARRMKGELSASSAGPGRGSTFLLELPLADGALEVARG